MARARTLFVGSLVLLLLVPPWQRRTGYSPQFGHYGGDAVTTDLPGGHRFVFTPPKGRVEIAWARLAAELGAAAALTFGVAWALAKR